MTWIAIIIGIIALIILGGVLNPPVETRTDTEDMLNRLAVLAIISDLKYTRPETWAKCASDIMGYKIDPPSPETIARYKELHPDK